MLTTLRRVFRPDPDAALRELLGRRPLPTFPVSMQRVLAALRDPETSLAEVGRRLAADPSLSVDVLRQVNAPAYGLRRPVADAAHAVRLLGRTELEGLLLGRAVQRALPTEGLDACAFWRVANERASLARLLAERVDRSQARFVFTVALLQDLAVPLLAATDAGGYRRVLADHDRGRDALIDHEGATDHAALGGALCRAWHFPTALAQAIADHHGDVPPVLRVVSRIEHVDAPTEPVLDAARAELGLAPEAVLEAWGEAKEAAAVSA